jgi:hypothetical protein
MHATLLLISCILYTICSVNLRTLVRQGHVIQIMAGNKYYSFAHDMHAMTN